MHLLKTKQVGMVAEFAEPIERWSGKYRVSLANIHREPLLQSSIFRREARSLRLGIIKRDSFPLTSCAGPSLRLYDFAMNRRK